MGLWFTANGLLNPTELKVDWGNWGIKGMGYAVGMGKFAKGFPTGLNRAGLYRVGCVGKGLVTGAETC